MLVSGDLGIEWMRNLFNQMIAENRVPEDCNKSVIVNCFKNKGNNRELKQLQLMMKVFERVIEQKVTEMLDIDALQFRFMPVKGIMNAIFIINFRRDTLKRRRRGLFILPLWTLKN